MREIYIKTVEQKPAWSLLRATQLANYPRYDISSFYTIDMIGEYYSGSLWDGMMFFSTLNQIQVLES